MSIFVCVWLVCRLLWQPLWHSFFAFDWSCSCDDCCREKERVRQRETKRERKTGEKLLPLMTAPLSLNKEVVGHTDVNLTGKWRPIFNLKSNAHRHLCIEGCLVTVILLLKQSRKQCYSKASHTNMANIIRDNKYFPSFLSTSLSAFWDRSTLQEAAFEVFQRWNCTIFGDGAWQ